MSKAILIQTTTLVFCLLFVTTVFSSILEPPQNDAVPLGSNIVLRCRVSSTTTRVQWFEYATNPSGAQISDGDLILSGHPNSDRYSLNRSPPDVYDLQIAATVAGDGGSYKCVEMGETTASAYAQLVMIDGEPICTTNIPESGFYTGYVREDQYYTVDCLVNYRGNVAPIMTWTGPENYTVGSSVTNNSSWSGISIDMKRSMEAQHFQVVANFTEESFNQPGYASNAPKWNFAYSTPDLYVQWSPKNMYISPDKESYEIGEVIDCYADANPAAAYFWQNLDTNERFDGYQLVLNESMVGSQPMRCSAANNITGLTYTNDIFFTLIVNPRTTTPPPTTPSSTTPVPAQAECDDLSGRWMATSPHAVTLCLQVDNSNYGRVVGIMRNASDPYFIEVRGRVLVRKYNQIGFTGIWPTDIGTLTFTGICKKCYGVEKLQLDGIGRKVSDNPSCENPGPYYYTENHLLERVGPPCAQLIKEHFERIHQGTP
jgi:hypothetical protein